MARLRRWYVNFGVLALAATLAGCQSNSPENLPLMSSTQGNATPAASPAAEIAGTDISGYGNRILALDSIDSVIALRTDTQLVIGTQQQLEDQQAWTASVPAQCGQLSTSKSAFVLACGDTVHVFDAANPQQRSIAVSEDFPVSAAALLDSGELFVASDQSPIISYYRGDTKVDSFRAERESTHLLPVPNGGQRWPDSVVRTQREDTTIQSLDWTNNRAGGRLRVGQGFGEATVGADGTVVLSDTIGRRIAIYTATDVVRLHQYGTTAGSPWAVAYDDNRQWAWVTLTDSNQVQAFAIASGVPEPVALLDTIADAHFLTVLPSGTVVTASGSSATIHFSEG